MTNTALIQDLYAAFRRGDIPTILGKLSNDVSWTGEGPAEIPYCGTFQGPDQVVRFFQGLAGIDQPELEIDSFVEQLDIVATTGRWKGVVRATGHRFDVPIGHFFTIRGGKIARFIDLQDTAALAAAHSHAMPAAK